MGGRTEQAPPDAAPHLDLWSGNCVEYWYLVRQMRISTKQNQDCEDIDFCLFKGGLDLVDIEVGYV